MSEQTAIRRLFIDIETSPNVVFSWRVGRKISIDYQNILKERAIICVCWKWEGETRVSSARWDGKQNDAALVKQIVGVLNEADEVVGHNIERFDLPWIRTRAATHGIITDPHYKTVDTLALAKRRFYFNSNRLDYIARFLGIGAKIHTEFDLWKQIALKNDRAAMEKMVRYCKQDVLLLEKVFLKECQHFPAHTHVGVLNNGEKWTCPYCGSDKIRTNGLRITARGVKSRQMQCLKDGQYYRISERAYEQFTEWRREKQRELQKARKVNA